MKNIEIEKLLKEKLQDFPLNKKREQRVVGEELEIKTKEIVKKEDPVNYKEPLTNRTIDDFTLVSNGRTHLYDVKSHFIQKKGGFSMPNLISVKRLRDDVLMDESITLSYIFIHYEREEDGKVIIKDVYVKYIWELDWSILRIGALGKGQLQIKNANKKFKDTKIGREKWFQELKKEVIAFYKKELPKMKDECKTWDPKLKDDDFLCLFST